MMTYVYRCPACGPFEQPRPLAERNDPLACPGCGAPGARQLTTPTIFDGLERAHGVRWDDGSGLPAKKMKSL